MEPPDSTATTEPVRDRDLPISPEETSSFLNHLTEEFSDEFNVDPTFLRYGLARYILLRKLGQAWCERHLSPASSSGTYFDPREGTLVDPFEHQARVEHLADILLNLEDVPGMRVRLERLASDQRNLESTIGELEGAMFIHRAGFRFEFLEEVGERRRDFDVRVFAENGIFVNCEMKCKLHDTALTMNTIKRSLDGARSQLPRGEAGVIFVRIPGAWTFDPSTLPIVERTVRRFFGQTALCAHIIGIVFHWERWYILDHQSGPVARAQLFRPISNEQTRFQTAVNDFLATLQQNAIYGVAEERTWTTIADSVRRHFERNA